METNVKNGSQNETVIRIYNALAEYCGNWTKLAKRLGCSKTALKGRKDRYSFDAFEAARVFPEISTEWLLYGTGPMLACEAEADIERALDTLGITQQDVDYIQKIKSENNGSLPPTVPSGSAACQDKVGTRSYTFEPVPTLQVAEDAPIDRALINILLREKSDLEAKLASKDQELEQLRQRNLDLEKKYAVASDRLQNAELWYRSHATSKQ